METLVKIIDAGLFLGLMGACVLVPGWLVETGERHRARQRMRELKIEEQELRLKLIKSKPLAE